MPFEDHEWAQGSGPAENRYNTLVDEMGMEGTDEAYADMQDIMGPIKEMVQQAEGGMSGASTRHAYGAYLGLIPKLAASLGMPNGQAAQFLLMAGANPQGVGDAMKLLEGNY